MDEALEVAELGIEFLGEGAFAWLLRILGILLVVGGIGVFLLTEVTVLVPVAMVLVGLVLIVAPSILLFLLELA